MIAGAERIRTAFADAAARQRSAFVAYLMAGHPSDEDALAAAEACLAGGADLLELGVPFSDPLADGPTIAEAGRAALATGGGLASAVRLARSLRERGHERPLLAMSYLNPLLAGGGVEALGTLAAAGVDGLIVPDLPAGELRWLERAAADLGLAMTFLVAPNTSPARIRAAAGASTGFLYVVPLFGVTGARERVAAGAGELLGRIRAEAGEGVPLAAGFGLSTPEQVAALAQLCDGVIVGSAIVAAQRNGGAAAVERLVHELASATTGG